MVLPPERREVSGKIRRLLELIKERHLKLGRCEVDLQLRPAQHPSIELHYGVVGRFRLGLTTTNRKLTLTPTARHPVLIVHVPIRRTRVLVRCLG